MRELLVALRESIAAGRPVVVCRLLATRGSTPQKPGANMLVFADGSQAGTLGGGCVEADVRRHALAALAAEAPCIASFQLDDDYGWDDGLICGGRMQVLVDPLTATPAARSASEYYQQVCRLVESGGGGTEVIVLDAAAGLAPGGMLLFDAGGQPVAAARLEPAAAELPAIRDGLRPLALRPRPAAHHGVAFLPLLPQCRLLIVGGGHVGQAVAALAADLEFQITVVDDRAEFVSSARFPRAANRLSGKIGDLLRQEQVGPDTYCVIVTRGHNHDEEALYHLVGRGAAYVGMIGSRRKIRLIFDDLAELGVAPETLDQVHAPIGLDIGSQAVPEIAVSIAAELVAHRNRALRRHSEYNRAVVSARPSAGDP